MLILSSKIVIVYANQIVSLTITCNIFKYPYSHSIFSKTSNVLWFNMTLSLLKNTDAKKYQVVGLK